MRPGCRRGVARAWLLLASAGLVGVAACAAEQGQALDRAWAEVEAGRFSDAERMLRAQVRDPDAPVADEAAVALEIIRRIRLDHRVTPEQMLAKLRDRIPDATAEDLERWRQQGVLQHRVIDGEVRYFNNAAGNLLRFSPEAKARATVRLAPAGYAFDTAAHIERLVGLAERSQRPYVYPVRQRMRYELHVKDGHPRVRAGARVRAWLPFPQEYGPQRDVRLMATEPPGGIVAPRDAPQRTVYLEQTIGDAAAPPKFAAEFEFTTFANVPDLDPARVRPYDTAGDIYREFTAERRPHIVFTPEVRALAAEIVGDETNPLLRALRVFRWVSGNIRWCSEYEYSTIPNLSGKGLAARRGDCGVQGLVFITLCRAAGVPARWQSGWQTQPNEMNMHDWSEFYVEPWGWLPADASYGVQEHADPRVQDFFCGHMDPYRLIVNLDYGRALHPPKTSFRSEPNDFQRGEIEIDGHNLYFDEWRWSVQLDTVPLDGNLWSLGEALDAAVPGLLQDGGVPGVVIAVGRKTAGGFETWQKAYGFQQVEPTAASMSADAIFDLASMTKAIATGTSLALLIERGRVGLDDPVRKYLPEFGAEGKERVTVRQLMTHMSGMPPYVGAGQQKVIKEKAGFPCPAETRAFIRALPLARPAGEAVVYSCLNAILCAEIVEAVSGQPVDRFAAENIFGPLKMDDTGFNPSAEKDARIVPTTKAAYGRGAGDFLRGQVHDPLAAMQGGVSGNAGLFSTAGDLSRLAQMMLNGGELDGVRVLRAETVAAMTRVQNPGATNAQGRPDRRGLLWDLYVPDADDTGVDALFAYGHTGYTGTAIRIYPEQGVYVIALANRVHPADGGKVDALRRRVWAIAGEVLMGAAGR